MRLIELCPKCNSAPEIVRVGNQKEYFVLMCPKCYHTAAKNNEASITVLGAIVLWNERR